MAWAARSPESAAFCGEQRYVAAELARLGAECERLGDADDAAVAAKVLELRDRAAALDAGRGAVMRMAGAGSMPPFLAAVLVTHLPSAHACALAQAPVRAGRESDPAPERSLPLAAHQHTAAFAETAMQQPSRRATMVS